MSTAYVPRQQHHTDAPAPPEAPPTPPHASEATRLLCAGTYQDAEYRDLVIEQLYLDEQRIVAPSPGFDAARVLAHALRARRQELLWSAAVIGLWAVGLAVSGWLLGLLVPAGLLLALAPWLRGGAEQPPLHRLFAAFVVRWQGRLLFAGVLVLMVAAAFGAGPDDESGSGSSYGSYDPYDSYGSGSSGAGSSGGPDSPGGALLESTEPWQAWFGIGVLVLIALCAAARRDRFARAFAAELSPKRFPDLANDPAEQAAGERLSRLVRRVRREQHAPLIMYDEARPFCGAGTPCDTWVLAVELRPDEGAEQQPLGNRAILERIRPLLEQLRVPAEHAGPAVRDRLRRLEIDECVFLPVEGLADRDHAPYSVQEFEQHRARAVEEGGEKRRHFLRIRVGGWDEELVVTVFVRVHTQGRMLMLEVAPHVLNPVRAEFREADRTSHRLLHDNVLGKAAGALALVPGSAGRSLAALVRGGVFAWRLLTGGYAAALPDGPALSVRELAAADGGSTFQEMDVARYLRSIQDRIGRGVRQALADAGYETGEFAQKIVNISNGAVHIDRVEGSTFAIGEHASASGGAAPRKGDPDHGTR
ncbi:hypothetical protein [Streptomyces griseomycini]|uniref:Uncharacterized protein n=1 Tax=Streptomyces griseomycini TaxID=66895 RepID=A0A7W7LX98_9ACTN|nr:hypothetical protein [Streptomyces griseomycini]MBB4897436.1 hypothetical protein [Streptomyces griseomycini]GGR13922.1 hypothetical protein GCM10015536_19570 [Streptomyces griseomycini]